MMSPVFVVFAFTAPRLLLIISYHIHKKEEE